MSKMQYTVTSPTTNHTATILIVEDDALQREMLQSLIQRKTQFNVINAVHGRAALDILRQDIYNTIRLVILDIHMPVMDGMQMLDVLRRDHPDIAVIIQTTSRNMDNAIEAMKKGALDFINKPYESERILASIRNALKITLLSNEVKRLSAESNGSGGFKALVGARGGLFPVIEQCRKAAATTIPILLNGETGTGKDVFARAIHSESPRKDAPFIAVNCGAIPHLLAESVLFGHEKGAFTGASEKTTGKFREANSGTLFLDEIGELPLDIQVKLLRALQQHEIEPVGSSKSIPVNIRLIAATNRNLEDEIKAGRFREDLYYRLNVFTIELPPLRMRKRDIPALAHHFIERFCARENTEPKSLSPDLLQKFQSYDWPGNIRELENTINRAMVISESEELNIHDLGNYFSLNTTSPPSINGDNVLQKSNHAHDIISNKNQDRVAKNIALLHDDNTIKTIAELEYEAMQMALQHHSGNITQAAKSLGIAKSTFYKKMKDHGHHGQLL